MAPPLPKPPDPPKSYSNQLEKLPNSPRNFPLLNSPRNWKKSFADILSGQNQPKITVRQPSSYRGKPATYLSVSEVHLLAKPFRFALIGKFSHGRPPMESIRNVFREFGLKGEYSLGLLDYKHILIKLNIEEDYTRIFLISSYLINNSPMRIFKWAPDFNPKAESSIAPVWISFPYLPAHMFDKSFLFNLGNLIGNPLKIDEPTANSTRPSVARICVEVDVAKDFVDKVWIGFEEDGVNQITGKNGMWQDVIYENRPEFCKCCLHIGHSEEKCLIKSEGKVLSINHTSGITQNIPHVQSNMRGKADQQKQNDLRIWVEKRKDHRNTEVNQGTQENQGVRGKGITEILVEISKEQNSQEMVFGRIFSGGTENVGLGLNVEKGADIVMENYDFEMAGNRIGEKMGAHGLGDVSAELMALKHVELVGGDELVGGELLARDELAVGELLAGDELAGGVDLELDTVQPEEARGLISPSRAELALDQEECMESGPQEVDGPLQLIEVERLPIGEVLSKKKDMGAGLMVQATFGPLEIDLGSDVNDQTTNNALSKPNEAGQVCMENREASGTSVFSSDCPVITPPLLGRPLSAGDKRPKNLFQFRNKYEALGSSFYHGYNSGEEYSDEFDRASDHDFDYFDEFDGTYNPRNTSQPPITYGYSDKQVLSLNDLPPSPMYGGALRSLNAIDSSIERHEDQLHQLITRKKTYKRGIKVGKHSSIREH